MDLPKVMALFDHWKQVPPPAIALMGIASALGAKPASPTAPRKRDKNNGISYTADDKLASMVFGNGTGSF